MYTCNRYDVHYGTQSARNVSFLYFSKSDWIHCEAAVIKVDKKSNISQFGVPSPAPGRH